MSILVLLCINQYTKFEMLSFTNYKYMIAILKAILKWGHVTLITLLLWVVCHRRLGFDTIYLRVNLTILA